MVNAIVDDLIDRGDYYEIVNYKPTVVCNNRGAVTAIINCPYIPKVLCDQPAVKD